MPYGDRRLAHRYRVPAQARLWWEGNAGVAASVTNVSATGCRFEGEVMPRLGEPVWVSLTMSGFPDLRLPARAVHESAGSDGTPRAAVRFNVLADRVSGLELLLLQRVQEQTGQGVVLVVEADTQVREQMLKTVRRGGALGLGVASVADVERVLAWLRVDTLLARAHAQGAQALLTLGVRLPHTRRVVMGSGDAAAGMLARGEVDLLLDDGVGAHGLAESLRALGDRPAK